jgi:hypothetical protein
MPPSLGALFPIAIGSSVLAVPYRDGKLPASNSLLHAYRPNREDNPVAFHVFL